MAKVSICSLLLVLQLLMFLCPETRGQYRSPNRQRQRRDIGPAPGPNMCKVLHVYHSRDKFFTHCLTNYVKMICDSPTYERWECCSGFQRKRGEKGCPKEKPLENVMDTALDLGATQFIGYANMADMKDKLTKGGAITVFMPSNEAFSTMSREIRTLIDPQDGSLSLLNYHIAPGRLSLDNFGSRNGEFVTFYANSMLRVNKYSFGVATVNCARIVRPDEMATNGIVHVIDKVISPWDMESSLAERVMSDGRFSQFQMAVLVAGMAKQLNSKRYHYTLLAPTNKAFSKLPSDILDKILTDADTAEKVIRRHVVKGVYCADAIVVAVGLKTLDDARLLFRCKRDGLWINEAKVTDSDIVASNGVLHGIDTVFLPDRVKSAGRVLEERGDSEFHAMTKDALEDGNVTILVPPKADVQAIRARYGNASSTEPLFKHHVVRGSKSPSQMIDGETLETLSNFGIKIKVQISRKGVSLDGKLIKSKGVTECENNTNILEMEGMLTTSANSLMDEIKADPELSEFAQMMEKSGVWELLLPEGTYTVVAPTNRAFSHIQSRQIESIKNSQYRLKKFVLRHISPRMVSKCMFPDNGVYTILSVQFDTMDFAYNSRKELYVGRHARVLNDDQMTRNGVLYKVDHVLPCSCERRMLTKTGRYITSSSYRKQYR